ncbi:MAG: hypothetical protein J6W08_01890, partial [Alphaproteobacteria bacterium]|nr:hypothetical protein [Alphaproteobacteria bacterium]
RKRIMKKTLFTSVFALILGVSAFADNEPTVLPDNATCNEDNLGVSSGSADIEIAWEANTITTQWYTGYGPNGQAASPTTCSYDGTINLPQTNPSRPGYAFNGWKLRASQCAILSTNLGVTGTASASKSLDGNGANDQTYGGATLETYGLTQNGEWGVSFSYGKIKGISSCTTTVPVNLSEFAQLTNPERYALICGSNGTGGQGVYPSNSFSSGVTGPYCWCHPTHYIANGAQQCAFAPTSWLFTNAYTDATDCADSCAHNCEVNVRAVTADCRQAALGNDNISSGGNGGGGQSNDFSLATLDASIDGTAHGWLNNAQSGQNASVYGLENANTWGVSFSYGKVIGSAFCSSATGDNHSWDWGTPSSDWTGTNTAVTAAAGANCWCKGTGFIASGSSTTQNTTSSSWTYHSNYGDTSTCQSFCAGDCGNYIEGSSNLRSALFNN